MRSAVVAAAPLPQILLAECSIAECSVVLLVSGGHERTPCYWVLGRVLTKPTTHSTNNTHCHYFCRSEVNTLTGNYVLLGLGDGNLRSHRAREKETKRKKIVMQLLSELNLAAPTHSYASHTKQKGGMRVGRRQVFSCQQGRGHRETEGRENTYLFRSTRHLCVKVWCDNRSGI
jgi:hypothetical protein